MNKFKSHFRFTKQERSGIFFLLLLIVMLQGVYFYIKVQPFKGETHVAVDTVMQSELDSLRLLALEQDHTKLFPFNPNYITDYKGYTLGMSPEELDRLFAYRKKGRFVNSAKEFQKVTGISDALLSKISPLFTFPKWTKKDGKDDLGLHPRKVAEDIRGLKDLNLATAEELRMIYGIGEKLSVRIVKFRDRLGGFLVDEQLYDVYGLEQEVVNRMLKRFKVLNPPKVEKININTATAEEISRLIYINRKVADKIVTLRDEKGNIESFEELFNLNDFPINKIDRIKLYLTL